MIDRLTQLYDLLLERYGKQNWWPAESKDEVIIGAILTQNTNWSNVEKAINNLKRERVCSLSELTRCDLEEIAQLIRPSGFYNQKAARLKNVSQILINWKPGQVKVQESREFLLSIKGIGEETADSILLYAYEIPFFVIDQYTKRLFSRMGFLSFKSSYSEWQSLFMNNLPKEVELFNEYHALIVKHCKTFCRKTPSCRECVFDNEDVCKQESLAQHIR